MDEATEGCGDCDRKRCVCIAIDAALLGRSPTDGHLEAMDLAQAAHRAAKAASRLLKEARRKAGEEFGAAVRSSYSLGQDFDAAERALSHVAGLTAGGQWTGALADLEDSLLREEVERVDRMVERAAERAAS